MGIKITCKNGAIHIIPENREYKLRDLCGEQGLAEINRSPAIQSADHDLLTRMASSLSVPTADFLLAAGKALHIECKWCELRNQVMRRVKELGVLKATYLIGKTLLMRDFTEKEKQGIEGLTDEQGKG